MKEIKPLPIKLGEIKEMDSVVFESTGRNKNQEEQNKNTRKSSDENSKNSNRKEINDDSKASKSKFPPANKKNIKSSFFNNDEMKEDEKEAEKNEINNESKKNNDIDNKNNSINNFSKKESKINENMKNTFTVSIKNTFDENQSKEDKDKMPKINTFKKRQSSIQKTKNYLDDNNNEKDNNYNSYKSGSNKIISYISNEATNNPLKAKNIDNLLIENSLLNGSGSFGDYKASNILETLSGVNLKEKDGSRKNKKSDKKKDNGDAKESGDESSSLAAEPKKKKKNNFKFDAYNDESEESEKKDSLSFDIISSLNEGENYLIKKIKNIEEKERNNNLNKNKNRMSLFDKYKKRKEINEDKNTFNLYMLNLRETTANAAIQPFTITVTKGIFFQFFKKE
jgi:hypothetical protein